MKSSGECRSNEVQILPKKSDFIRWSKTFDDSGDLVFASQSQLQLLRDLGGIVLTKEEVKAQSGQIWSLNQRSWYRYALDNSEHCAFLPPSAIENLPEKQVNELASEQIRRGVPVLLEKKHVAQQLASKLYQVKGIFWLTSASWQKLSSNEKTLATEGWFAQADIEIRTGIKPTKIENFTKRENEIAQWFHLVDTFSPSSGPNCFAAVAQAIFPTLGRMFYKQWLHWGPFSRFLQENGYFAINMGIPQERDILVFARKDLLLHAVFCLDGTFCFEKLGQDFYEPYRIQTLVKLFDEWPGTDLRIWRKATSSF